MLSSLLSPNKLQIQQPTQMWVFKSEPEIEQESDMSHDNSNSKKDGKIHLIAIYHNRGTMQRYILINFQEVSSTKGFSNVLMDDIDRIPLEFSRFLNSHKSSSSSSSPSGKMDSNPSNYVEIRKVGAIKDGYIGTFDYNCIIQSVTCRTIKEAVPHFMTWTPLFEISLQPLVSNIMMPADKKSVAYYGIQVINLQTMSSNTIHRRYSEFSILDDCIRHFFITQDALPPLPSKSVSFLVDHNDHQFLKVRKDGLEQYLLYLSKIPFIEHLPEYRQFLGYHSTYKLLSYDLRSCSNYEQIFLLDSTSKHSIMNSGCIYSASVSSVVNAYVCAELRIGDFLSKINGTDLTGLPYNSVIRMLNESPKPLLLQFSQSLNTMQQSSFSSVGGTGSSSNGGYVPNTMTQSYSSSAIEKPSYSPNGPGSNNSGNNPHTYGSTPPAKPPRAGKFNTTTSSTTNTAMGNINNTNSNQNGSPSCSSNSVKTTNTTTAVSKLRIPLALSSQLAADSSYSNKCSYDNYNHSHARVSEHVVVLPPSAVPPRMMTSTTYTTRSESTLSPDHYSSISASSEGYKPFVLPPPLSRVEPIVVLPPPAVPPRLMTTTVPTPYSSVSVSGDGHTPFVLPPPMSRVKPVSTKYDEVCDDDI